MQAADTSNHTKKSNETKSVAVKRKSRPKKTTNKTTKGPTAPCNTLDSASILSIANSLDHDRIQNNVTKRKKKRRKRTKKNNGVDAAAFESKDTPAQATKAKPKSNLKSSIQKATNPVTKHAIKSFDRPRQSYDPSIKSKVGGADIVGLNKIIPQDIAGGDNNQTKKEIYKEDVTVASTDQTQVAWEHFALLIEEYMLAKDVRM